MRIEKLRLSAGTILMWKEYNPFIKLWNKVRYKRLPYNKYTILTEKTEFTTLGTIKDVLVAEPVKPYSKLEAQKLSAIAPENNNYLTWEELTTTVNLIRPKTFLQPVATSIPEDIKNNKYYDTDDFNKKLDYTIYKAK